MREPLTIHSARARLEHDKFLYQPREDTLLIQNVKNAVSASGDYKATLLTGICEHFFHYVENYKELRDKAEAVKYQADCEKEKLLNKSARIAE